jgi:cell division septation protein DedD
MTRMAPIDDREPDAYDDEPRRSIFSTLWFRALIVVLVLGVVAAVAVPYVLEMVNAPPRVAQAPPVPVAPPAQRAVTPESPGASQPPAMPRASAPMPAPPETAPAKPVEIAKPADTARMTPPKTAAARRSSAAIERPAAPREAPGPYWVQVGAFRDQAAARRLADTLRSDNYKVEESSTPAATVASPAPDSAVAPAPPPVDRYNVFVSGLAPAELKAKLDAKGLGSEAVAGGVVLTPSLPLREAVALSRDLAGDGLQVQVRRASGSRPSLAARPAAMANAATFHRVRVGSFPDRASARAVLKELEAKGFKPFLARGAP